MESDIQRTISFGEIDQINKKRTMDVAKSLDKKDIIDTINMLLDINNNIPSIVEYNNKAIDISSQLKMCYNKIGVPNLFHHYIKQIDPDIYGKAQTMLNVCRSLVSTLIEVCYVMKDLGKIESVEQYKDEDGKIIVKIEGVINGFDNKGVRETSDKGKN